MCLGLYKGLYGNWSVATNPCSIHLTKLCSGKFIFQGKGVSDILTTASMFNSFEMNMLCLFLFVCLGSATAFFPRGQLPKEDLRRPPSTTQATRHPRALCQCLFPLPPYFCLECLLHPVCTLPCPPVLYIYPIESLVCIPVLHIYSNPTGKNPSTYFKPHKQTVLIQYLNKRNN